MHPDTTGVSPTGHECPRCRAPFEPGVTRGCRSCGLALGAEGGLPYALDADSHWPNVAPPFDPRRLLRGLLAGSGLVLGLLAFCLLILNAIAGGAARDAAFDHLSQQPQVVAALGRPVSLRFSLWLPTQASSGGARYFLLLGGPEGLGLGRLEIVNSQPSFHRYANAGFRTLSGDWVALGRRGQPAQAPAPVLAAIQNARAHLQEDRLPAALDALDRAVALAPGWAESWYLRAVTLRRMGERSLAREDVRRALDLGYPEIEAATLAVELLPEGSAPTLALDIWNAFLLGSPEHPNARVELALAQLAAGDLALARATLSSFCARGHARACEELRAVDQETPAAGSPGAPGVP